MNGMMKTGMKIGTVVMNGTAVMKMKMMMKVTEVVIEG